MNKEKLQELVNQMTIEEKIGQLQQLTGNFYTDSEAEITGPLKEHGLSAQMVADAGSVLGLSGAEELIKVQKSYLENSRLQIPLLFMADIIHGYRTIFPIPLGLASSWSPELMKEASEVAAKESAVGGLHVTFSPMVDLVRDPRWGRVMESTGEDPMLNRHFARAAVEGYQGSDLRNDLEKIAACVKHFAAYGAPEGGREYNTVDMSERMLRDMYLPSYKEALDAGSKLVMTAFNTVDGIPATANKKLNRDILRGEFGFDGVLISDWAAIKEVIAHGVAGNDKEAALLAMEAGVDIEMMTFCYQHFLKELLAEDLVSIDLVDEAVLRILELKDDLGLFENPYRGANAEAEARWVYSEEHKAISEKVAQESVVLLKNQKQVLPLVQDQKLALIGPFVDNGEILGTWSWKGDPKETQTIQSVFETSEEFKQVSYASIQDVNEVTASEEQAALATARDSDKLVLLFGENFMMSGEASSRTDIRLPEAQLKLIDQLAELKKPMVLVLFNGRPLALSEIEDKFDAIIEAWFPGTKGAQVIHDILSGKVNPSGKITMSFPRNVGQIPVYYNHFNTGRPINFDDIENKYVSKYLDVANTPLYPFGHGLSYSEFSYNEFKTNQENYTLSETIHVSVEVTNTSQVAGLETVQLYVHDIVGQVVRPMQELKGYKKIKLAAGETQVVAFELTSSDLAYVHSDFTRKADPGEFEIMVGTSSEIVQTVTISLK